MEQLHAYEGLILDALKSDFLGITMGQGLVSLAFVFGGFLLRKVLEHAFEGLEKAVKRTETIYDDLLLEIVRKPVSAASVPLGIYFAVRALPLPTKPVDVAAFLGAAFKTVTVVFAVWLGLRFIDGVCKIWLGYAKKTESSIDDMLVPIVRKSLKSFLVIVGGILALQNMGYSVGSLLAGFGLGGMAFALAAKETLSNVFGSIVILLDRPFKVGDWIEMDGLEGTIEEIGLRTTRVRTFANSLITVPNAKWTTSAINNWSRMRKRRISTKIGVTYGATPEQLEGIVETIRGLIRADENLHDDFFLVNFDGFGASSQDIFIYCFTKTTNWAEFLQAKEKFFLNVARAVRSAGLEFAFPTQTVHLGGPVELAKN